MRLAAVKLYEPHYTGSQKDMERGFGGRLVYPIAIGHYRVFHQPCGRSIDPSESSPKRVVCMISQYDADRMSTSYGYGFKDKADVPEHDQGRYEWLWKNYGDTRDGPDWQWTVALCTPQSLLPADEYNKSRFTLEEWQASVDLALSAHRDAETATQEAITALRTAVGIVMNGAKLKFQPFTDDLRVVDGTLHGEVRVLLDSVLAALVRRRKMTKACKDLVPVSGFVSIEIGEAIRFAANRDKVPQQVADAIAAYEDAVTRRAGMLEAYHEISACRPGQRDW